MTPPLLTITRGTPSSMGFEIQRLRALGTTQALIEWPLPPDDGDEAISAPAAAVLCRVLLRSGHLAFRWDDGAPAAGGSFFPEPSSSLVTRVMARLLHNDAHATFGVLVTGDETVARNVFTWGGWSVGMQAVLVHDPAADLAPIVQALQHGMDWWERTLPPGSRLVFGSGHDGGFALVAAPAIEQLDGFIANVETEMTAWPGHGSGAENS